MKPTFAVGHPEPSEFAASYANYIAQVGEGEIVNILERQGNDMQTFLGSLVEASGDLRYAPGKWSIKEVIGHLIDSERVFAYRAMRFGRGDATPLPGFEQEVLARNAPYAKCTLAELAEEFVLLRRSTVLLLSRFDQQAWMRRGVAFDREVSVRALAYVIAGHELHHRRVIGDKYLASATA